MSAAKTASKATAKGASKVRLAVAGSKGRMGKAIVAVASADPGMELCGAWDRDDDPAPALQDAQVVIDFTTPAATMQNLKLCAARKLALVIGTTGMDEAQHRAVAAFARKVPCVMSSNYSIGVNLLWKVAAEVARITGEDYDMEIVDVHHHHKKDSPSGTAETTAEVLARARGRRLKDIAVYGRHSRDEVRKRGELGIHALRAGDVVGDHTIYFAGPYERLELVHRAHARENFALGAVKAARWLIQSRKKSGLYGMAQVLGL
jgi:4-hydroxy-tetrahydrodipicolinate reductase